MTSDTSTRASGPAPGWLGRRRQTHWIGEGPALKGGARDAGRAARTMRGVRALLPASGESARISWFPRDPSGRVDRPASFHAPAGGQCARRRSCQADQALPRRGIQQLRPHLSWPEPMCSISRDPDERMI